jgi:hypothetical protein
MRSKRTKAVAQDTDRVLARHAEQIRKLCRRTAGDIIQIGKLLVAAKKRVGHGCWLEWLEKEFAWSADTAENFISVFEFSRTDEFRKIRNLPAPSVLVLLAKKSIPEPVRTMIVSRLNAGEPVKTADVVRATKERLSIQELPRSKSKSKPERLSIYSPPRRELPPLDLSRVVADQEADEAIAQIKSLARYARGSGVVHIVDRLQARDEFIEQLDELTEFVAHLKKALGVGVQAPATRPPEIPPDPDAFGETTELPKTKH